MSRQNINLFTDFYFGIKLLPKFVEMSQDQHKNIVCIGGRGSTKTLSWSMIMLWLCIHNPDYQVLWVSPSTDQSSQSFTELLGRISNSPDFRKFLPDNRDLRWYRTKPYPELCVQVENAPPSYIRYRSAGQDESGDRLRRFSLDRAHLDEGGWVGSEYLISNVLRPACRGQRIYKLNGEAISRDGIISVATSPSDVEWIQHWYNKATDENHTSYDPTYYAAYKVRTKESLEAGIISPEQYDAMVASMPPEVRRVELDAEFPELSDRIFPHKHIEQCIDHTINDEIDALEHEGLGNVIKHPDHGLIRFELPPQRDHMYLISGDPGTGIVPMRGAGAIMVFDVSLTPAKLVAFHWVTGNGQWTPFLNSYKKLSEKYDCVWRILDATGGQNIIVEREFRNIPIDGMTMGKDKDEIIIMSQIALERMQLRYPRISGLTNQLRRYQLDDKKIAQDIVMALGQACLRIFQIMRFRRKECEYSESISYYRKQNQTRRRGRPQGRKLRRPSNHRRRREPAKETSFSLLPRSEAGHPIYHRLS